MDPSAAPFTPTQLRDLVGEKGIKQDSLWEHLTAAIEQYYREKWDHMEREVADLKAQLGNSNQLNANLVAEITSIRKQLLTEGFKVTEMRKANASLEEMAGSATAAIKHLKLELAGSSGQILELTQALQAEKDRSSLMDLEKGRLSLEIAAMKKCATDHESTFNQAKIVHASVLREHKVQIEQERCRVKELEVRLCDLKADHAAELQEQANHYKNLFSTIQQNEKLAATDSNTLPETVTTTLNLIDLLDSESGSSDDLIDITEPSIIGANYDSGQSPPHGSSSPMTALILSNGLELERGNDKLWSTVTQLEENEASQSTSASSTQEECSSLLQKYQRADATARDAQKKLDLYRTLLECDVSWLENHRIQGILLRKGLHRNAPQLHYVERAFWNQATGDVLYDVTRSPKAS